MHQDSNSLSELGYIPEPPKCQYGMLLVLGYKMPSCPLASPTCEVLVAPLSPLSRQYKSAPPTMRSSLVGLTLVVLLASVFASPIDTSSTVQFNELESRQCINGRYCGSSNGFDAVVSPWRLLVIAQPPLLTMRSSSDEL